MTATSSRSSAKVQPVEIHYSPAITRESQKEIAASLATPRFPKGQLLEALKTRDYIGEFRAIFEPRGLSHRDLGAVTAAHWITMWTIVHDRQFPPADAVAAAHQQLASS